MENIGDYAMYTAVFGMFSFAWFGWAQDNPKKHWRKYIGMASGISLVICLIGVYLSVKNWGAMTILSDKDALINYSIVFYAEMLIIGISAFFLIRSKNKKYVAPCIGFIVGAHFFWLKNVFNDPSLYILAVLMISIALLSPWLSKKMDVANGAITGIGSGFVLFCYAILGLTRYMLT